jgi:hypothetical protein
MHCSRPFAWRQHRRGIGMSNLSFSCSLTSCEQVAGQQKGSADVSPLLPKYPKGEVLCFKSISGCKRASEE